MKTEEQKSDRNVEIMSKAILGHSIKFNQIRAEIKQNSTVDLYNTCVTWHGYSDDYHHPTKDNLSIIDKEILGTVGPIRQGELQRSMRMQIFFCIFNAPFPKGTRL